MLFSGIIPLLSRVSVCVSCSYHQYLHPPLIAGLEAVRILDDLCCGKSSHGCSPREEKQRVLPNELNWLISAVEDSDLFSQLLVALHVKNPTCQGHESLQGCGANGNLKICLKLPKILKHGGKLWYGAQTCWFCAWTVSHTKDYAES